MPSEKVENNSFFPAGKIEFQFSLGQEKWVIMKKLVKNGSCLTYAEAFLIKAVLAVTETSYAERTVHSQQSYAQTPCSAPYLVFPVFPNLSISQEAHVDNSFNIRQIFF